MSDPSSAQSLLGADPNELNAITELQPGIVEFPISGDATTLAAHAAADHRRNPPGQGRSREGAA